jgi:ATP-dependent helicase HrpB
VYAAAAAFGETAAAGGVIIVRPPARAILLGLLTGAAITALLAGIREEGLAMLPWTRAAQQLRLRIQFMRLTDNAWPDLSDAALLARLESWLAPYAYNVKSSSELQQLKLCPIFESMLTREQRRELEEYAPTHIAVPSGQKIAVDYSVPDSPILAVKLQELFGLSQTPKIAQGKVPLTLKLLSPAQRPVQVTKDLASFWRTGYFEVKKDLMGRYPKHYWPDDPLQATPTHRVRPRE